MANRNPARIVATAIVGVLIVGAITPTAVASAIPPDATASASIDDGVGGTDVLSENATVTPTATPTERKKSGTAETAAAGSAAETCEPGPEEPQVQQADLHTSDSVIEKGSPGRVSGALVLDLQNNCPVAVQITMNVPSNMYIEGASDLSSGGGGVVTTTFVVEPGEVKDIGATVYGTEPGEHDVVTDITYYPVGHRDMAREIDGLTLTFEVVEPVQPPPTPDPRTETGGVSPVVEIPTVQWLLGLVTVAVVGLLVVAGRRTNIRIRK